MRLLDLLLRVPDVGRLTAAGDVDGLIKAFHYKRGSTSARSMEARRQAARALGDLGSTRAVDALIGGLKNDFFGGSMEAARALGKIGDRRAVEPLCELLSPEWGDICVAAAGSLGELRDERAIGPLAEVLRAAPGVLRRFMGRPRFKSLERGEVEALKAAASALGRIGGASSFEALTTAFVRLETEYDRETHPEVRVLIKEVQQAVVAASRPVAQALESEGKR